MTSQLVGYETIKIGDNSFVAAKVVTTLTMTGSGTYSGWDKPGSFKFTETTTSWATPYGVIKIQYSLNQSGSSPDGSKSLTTNATLLMS